VFRELAGTAHIVALVTPCKAKGDARTDVIMLKDYGAPFVMDVGSVVSLIGRVPRGNRWGIVDRGVDAAPITFDQA
jgi:hypothetical protein